MRLVGRLVPTHLAGHGLLGHWMKRDLGKNCYSLHTSATSAGKIEELRHQNLTVVRLNPTGQPNPTTNSNRVIPMLLRTDCTSAQTVAAAQSSPNQTNLMSPFARHQYCFSERSVRVFFLNVRSYFYIVIFFVSCITTTLSGSHFEE